MKTLILLSTIASLLMALAGNTSISSDPTPSGLTSTSQTKPLFSSRYTSLTGRGCGSGMTKQQEREAENHGSDIPTRCKGVGGYDIEISYSACTSEIQAEKGLQRVQLATQAVSWKQKTVEWRMAQSGGKTVPFAVIMRIYEHAGDDYCATNGKVTGEFLLVKGLKGFEHIDEKIDVRKTANPNLKARQFADQKYANASTYLSLR